MTARARFIAAKLNGHHHSEKYSSARPPSRRWLVSGGRKDVRCPSRFGRMLSPSDQVCAAGERFLNVDRLSAASRLCKQSARQAVAESTTTIHAPGLYPSARHEFEGVRTNYQLLRDYMLIGTLPAISSDRYKSAARPNSANSAWLVALLAVSPPGATLQVGGLRSARNRSHGEGSIDEW